MDPEIAEFARAFRRLTEDIYRLAPNEGDSLSEVGEHLQAFLGVPLRNIETVTETFLPHQVADVDQALEALLAEYGGDRLGISGQQRMHLELEDFLHHWQVRVGPVAYERRPVGPDPSAEWSAWALGRSS